MDQWSTGKRSAVHNFAPTVTKFCVMWEGRALPHDTKFGNCRCEMVGRRVIFMWSLIHGSSWSGLIKAEPGATNGDDMEVHHILDISFIAYIMAVKSLKRLGYGIPSWPFRNRTVHVVSQWETTFHATSLLICGAYTQKDPRTRLSIWEFWQ